MTTKDIQVGDLIFVRTNHFVSKLIRFGQRSYGKEAAQWNHVAICVYKEDKVFEDLPPLHAPKIVEALTKGVVESPLSKYKPDEIKIVRIQPVFRTDTYGEDSDAIEREMRRNAADFARSCVGQKYGYATIFAIALKVLFKGRLNFGVQGTEICSGVAARSTERAGYNYNPYDPAELTPAYLAKEV